MMVNEEELLKKRIRDLEGRNKFNPYRVSETNRVDFPEEKTDLPTFIRKINRENRLDNNPNNNHNHNNHNPSELKSKEEILGTSNQFRDYGGSIEKESKTESVKNTNQNIQNDFKKKSVGNANSSEVVFLRDEKKKRDLEIERDREKEREREKKINLERELEKKLERDRMRREEKEILNRKEEEFKLLTKNQKSSGFEGEDVSDGRPNKKELQSLSKKIGLVKLEMGKVVKGQNDIIEGLIMGLLCNAHVLVEGVPGIAKTLAIRALGSASGCVVKRIQFTVDLLPTDIIGLTNYTPDKGFEIIKGPIFTNFLIADEINRAPPKTQSALIEGMQEKQVTIGKESFTLPNPFFVMATENPIENAGVYPLPEAQIDRFLFKLIMTYPPRDVEKEVMETNMTLRKFEDFDLKPVINPKEIIAMQEIVKKVYLDDSIKDYIVSIVTKTRERDFEKSEYISYGSSPRASIGLFVASKARALIQGRNYVIPEDVQKVAYDVLRHRLILSYKAIIDKVTPESIIKNILKSVNVE